MAFDIVAPILVSASARVRHAAPLWADAGSRRVEACLDRGASPSTVLSLPGDNSL